MFGATARVLNLGWGLWVTELFVFLGLPLVALQLLGRPAVPLGRPTARLVLFGVVFGAINYFAWAVPLMSLAEQAKFASSFTPSRVYDHFEASTRRLSGLMGLRA